jgi:hypothetical protein
MNKFNLILGGIICIFISLSSCTSETETLDESTFGYDYFPLSKGKTWVYQSDSIVYSSVGTVKDTFRSFLKEEIGEAFLDLEGNNVYKINRYFKRKDTDAWSRINTWTTSSDQTRAIRTEENIRFIKLVFPIKNGLRFNGNLFVDEDLKIEVGGEFVEAYKNWKHKIESLESIVKYKNQDVKALQVNLVDGTSIIDRRKVVEYYGKGIGLLRKEMIILDSDGSKPNDPWENKAKKGFIHQLTLLDHN